MLKLLDLKEDYQNLDVYSDSLKAVYQSLWLDHVNSNLEFFYISLLLLFYKDLTKTLLKKVVKEPPFHIEHNPMTKYHLVYHKVSPSILLDLRSKVYLVV